MENQNQCSVNDILGGFINAGRSQCHQYCPTDMEKNTKIFVSKSVPRLVSAAWVFTALLCKDVQ